MKIFGADFSGARDPSRGIYYAAGSLDKRSLVIDQVVHCDDRLDLLVAIHFSKAPWGLDFPFSVSLEALKSLKISSWSELLTQVAKNERKDFNRFIADNGIPSCEVKCAEHSICCRAVDTSIHSFSPLKRTNPNMRMMTYAGLKLLSYLRRIGNVVYPYDQLDIGVSRLYEVYPSHTWHQVDMERSTAVVKFTEEFTNKYDFKVEIRDQLRNVESKDAADAVVACVTMAYALDLYRIEADWDKNHGWISAVEWEHRHDEGLIVKVN